MSETNTNVERPLTPEELHAALQTMQSWQTPGIDGLCVKFYKAYWHILSPDLLNVFKESLVLGTLPVSCRRAVIALLPKKGNLLVIKDWHMVTLLCTD